jgi:predicted acylesterase/phospholipase RssA
MLVPRQIYLCGGGVNVIAHLGALKVLQSKLYLKNIKGWLGVSAGALMALCFVVGFTVDEIEQVYLKFDFTNVSDIDSAPGWIMNCGMDTGNRLRKLIEAVLHIKGYSETITFKELYEKRNTVLKVYVTDLNEAKLICFSEKDTPERSVVDAVRASMSIPYYFQPFIDPISNHILVDGAVISNYPFFMLSSHEVDETLGIFIDTSPKYLEELGVDDILLRPMRIVLSMRSKHEVEIYKEQTIYVNCGDRNPVNFSISEESKKELMEMGRIAAEKYFENKKKAKPARRYSVG